MFVMIVYYLEILDLSLPQMLVSCCSPTNITNLVSFRPLYILLSFSFRHCIPSAIYGSTHVILFDYIRIPFFIVLCIFSLVCYSNQQTCLCNTPFSDVCVFTGICECVVILCAFMYLFVFIYVFVCVYLCEIHKSLIVIEPVTTSVSSELINTSL